ncbi:MAG: hypothetical protein COA54_02055 [Thiotrichaceae bacterium]|nr:MAG: hypothetical protein COA54_02055 [Thiotrichaceae bacterium]
MDTSIRLIATTTALSLAMHGVVVAIVLSYSGALVPAAEGVGPGVDIHLISSEEVADNFEAESFVEEYASLKMTKKTAEQAVEKREEGSRVVQAVQNNQHTILLSDTKQENRTVKPPVIELAQSDSQKNATQFDQATHASKQQHSIVELLHSRISDKKAYPYLARRQRREGVVTVAFILHPNGRIENAHLVHSSRTQSLDRAALTAVQSIEPFSVAQNYLKQSEKFQVDVAFNLL